MIDPYTETLEAVATAFERGIQAGAISDGEALILAAARNAAVAVIETYDPHAHRMLEEARCAAH